MAADDALLATLRRDHRFRWTATCTITRVTGRTWDDSTGTYTDATTTVYTGACQLLPADAQHTTPEVGGEDVNLSRYVLEVPADTATVPDDTVTITDGGADGSLTGQTFTVIDVPYSTWQAVRRVFVQLNRGA